jgi:hypothetical protein
MLLDPLLLLGVALINTAILAVASASFAMSFKVEQCTIGIVKR